jgi:O-antigen ligase
MTARLVPTERLWLAGLGFLAVLVGLLAGVNPKLAILAAGAVGFVLLTFTNLAVAIAIFCSEPRRVDFSGSNALRVAALLLLLSWLGSLIYRNENKADFISVHPAMSWVLGIFLGWSLLSAVWAEDPGATLIPDGSYALGIVIIFITFSAVRNTNQALLVISIYVVGAAMAAVYGMISTPTAQIAAEQGSRLSNPYLDPNELASTLVAGAVLGIGVAQCMKRSPALRLAAYGASGLCVLGIFLSASRGGLFALGVALLAAVFVSGRARGRVAVVAALVGAVGFYYFAALAPPDAKERIFGAESSVSSGEESRSTIWKVGVRMFKANPVAGVGAGNFINAERHYVLQPGALARTDEVIEAPKVAHNTYLGVAAELGVVGLALYLTIVIFSLRAALLAARNFRRRGQLIAEILARSLAVALIGLLTANFFLTQPYNKQLWFLFGMAPALLAISMRSYATGSEPR